jgi:hypothetical protein
MEIRFNPASLTEQEAMHVIFILSDYFPQLFAEGTVGGLTRSEKKMTKEEFVALFGRPPSSLEAARNNIAELDPAQVFGGNAAGAATAPGTQMPFPATVAPSAPIAAAPGGTSPAQVPASVASAPQGVELDVNGLPWDARIHALGEGGTHPKNKDGSWRAKRGLNDPGFVRRVEDELRAALTGAPVAPPSPPVPPAAPAVPPVVPPTAPPVVPSPPVAPVAPSASAAPESPKTFEAFMARIVPAMTSGILPKTAPTEAVLQYGVANVPALQSYPDKIEAVWNYLQAMYPQLQ